MGVFLPWLHNLNLWLSAPLIGWRLPRSGSMEAPIQISGFHPWDPSVVLALPGDRHTHLSVQPVRPAQARVSSLGIRQKVWPWGAETWVPRPAQQPSPGLCWSLASSRSSSLAGPAQLHCTVPILCWVPPTLVPHWVNSILRPRPEGNPALFWPGILGIVVLELRPCCLCKSSEHSHVVCRFCAKAKEGFPRGVSGLGSHESRAVKTTSPPSPLLVRPRLFPQLHPLASVLKR